jgi:hypothetical protein
VRIILVLHPIAQSAEIVRLDPTVGRDILYDMRFFFEVRTLVDFVELVAFEALGAAFVYPGVTNCPEPEERALLLYIQG